MPNPDYELVYSDDPAKKNPPSQSSAHKKAVMRIEKKGRGGKAVTVVERMSLSDDELKAICKDLKQKCGTGGTVKDHHIEIQGDFREKIRSWLSEKGYKVSG